MRLDKFLKVSRIIKRRTVANDACSEDRVLVNEKEAKPSKTLKVGDIITISFGDKSIKFRVLDLPSGNVNKKDADNLTEIVND